MTNRHVNSEQLHTIPILSHAVVVESAGMVYLSGQIAWNARGELVGGGSPSAQAAKISENIDTALAAAGTDRSRVVRETIYIVDCTPETAGAVVTALRGDGTWPAPAQTIVGVAALAVPGHLVEVDIVATV
ncbi:RidA family protein [soil metagenome]